MYPFVRLAKELAINRRSAPLGLFEPHVGRHRCWPQDIDMWMELNNGRTLTLYDLGRMVLFQRTGIMAEMRVRRWAGTVAGASVRYRRRVRPFDAIEMRSRIVGWDARFLYMEQSMWRPGGECTSHALLRTAVTASGRLVPMAEAAAAMGQRESPPLPGWIAAWAEAEGRRPWPPMQDAGAA